MQGVTYASSRQPRVGTQAIPGSELLCDLARKAFIEPALHVDGREFALFRLRLRGQLYLLALDVGLLGVALGADRNVFANCHRHRPADKPGQASDQHASLRR